MNGIPKIETSSSSEIRKYQFDRINGLLKYLESNSPFYQEVFKQNDITAGSIHRWSDFEKIPTTSKDDLQIRNWDFLCVPKSSVVEYTSTSGTMGKPVVVALTKNDVDRLAYNESLSFACADGSGNDLYQLMLTLDRQFMAGIAYYEGVRKLGAGLIRVGPGLPSLQWETILRLQPTALVAVPSFILRLLEFAKQNGIDYSSTSVKKIICIGETLRNSSFDLNVLGKRIRDEWDVTLFSTYASTEMQTAFTECCHGKGGHLHPELLYVEILNDHGQPAADGEKGEVTITTLGVEGMPLLRYRTGDIAAVYNEPCLCGRKSSRIGPIIGRKQQMIKLKGTTLYPPSVFEILQKVPDVKDYVVEVFTGELGTDELKIHLCVGNADKEQIKKNLGSIFQSHIRVIPEFYFVSTNEIEKLQSLDTNRKPRKFTDSRLVR